MNENNEMKNQMNKGSEENKAPRVRRTISQRPTVVAKKSETDVKDFKQPNMSNKVVGEANEQSERASSMAKKVPEASFGAPDVSSESSEMTVKTFKTAAKMPKEKQEDAFEGMDIFDFDAARKAKEQQRAKSNLNDTIVKKEHTNGNSSKIPFENSVTKGSPRGSYSNEHNLTKPQASVNSRENVRNDHAQMSQTGANQKQNGTDKFDAQVNKLENGVQNTKGEKGVQVAELKPEKVVYNASSPRDMSFGNRKRVKKKENILNYEEEKVKGSNPVTMLSKALIYIAVVLLISCIAAYFVVVVANDVFAFVKEDVQKEVNIPEYATLDQIADELHEQGVIKYPKMFVLYNVVRKKDVGEYLSGVYTVSPSQNYDELLSTFVKKENNSLTEVSVTIPEGYTVDDIIKLFVEEKGIGTREGFIDAIQNADYDYWFIDELKDLNPNRKYRLEGYLYPDTYYFYREWPETRIINKILSNFHSKFSIEYKQECEKVGMTVDQVVNLASIIQMEAKYSAEYSIVSSVIHNRLNSAYYNYRLDCDATIQYILPERKEDLTHADTEIDNPYNTYKNSGLPPGPISNPTLAAIRNALYPEETNYYFFVSDKSGHMLFAKTYSEHLNNIALVAAGK